MDINTPDRITISLHNKGFLGLYKIAKKSPLSVCWDITSRCNDKCLFCYRELDKPDLSLAQHHLLLSKIINSSVRKISFIGGEPLLVDHLPGLLEETRKAGLFTSIVTNGILLEQKWTKIADYVNWITLPIDGSNDQIQGQMTRRKDHLKLVFSRINMLKKFDVSIKINTLVGSHNITDLKNIARIINGLGVQRWKIFQFLPLRGYALRNETTFSISDQQFNNAVQDALSHIDSSSKCDITVADRNYLQRNYFSILQDGSVRVTVNDMDVIVGNLFRQSLNEIWQSPLFDHVKHTKYRYWLRLNPQLLD